MEEEKKNIPESEPDAASAAAPDQSAEGTPAAPSPDETAPASDGVGAEASAGVPAEEPAPASDGVGAAESAGVPAEESAPADEGAEPPAVPAPAEATPAADASPAAETAVSAAPVPESGDYDIEVKRPKRGRVRDREGFELGKLRRGVWYDTDKNRRGEIGRAHV